MKSDEYWQGFSSGLADKPQDEKNPYEEGTVKYQDWQDGFFEGWRNWDMNMDDGG